MDYQRLTKIHDEFFGWKHGISYNYSGILIVDIIIVGSNHIFHYRYN